MVRENPLLRLLPENVPGLDDSGNALLGRPSRNDTAEMLGWQERVGALQPRKFSGFVTVAGDPVAAITELERVRLVMKDGQVVGNDLAPQVRLLHAARE